MLTSVKHSKEHFTISTKKVIWTWKDKWRKYMLTLIYCSESSLNILMMLIVIYLRHTVLIYRVHQCGLTALKQLLKKWKLLTIIVRDVLWYYHGAIVLVKCSQIYAFHHLMNYWEFLFLVFGFWSRIIVSNKLFISSIYNLTCRIYSYMWTWLDNLLFMFPP